MFYTAVTVTYLEKKLQTEYSPQPKQLIWVSVFDTGPVNAVPVWVF